MSPDDNAEERSSDGSRRGKAAGDGTRNIMTDRIIGSMCRVTLASGISVGS